jgi:hypothetical protein
LLSGKVPKSEIISPITPTITAAVDMYPIHFQYSPNFQKLLETQNRISREEIAYMLRQRRGEYINLMVCAAALLVFAALRITKLKRPLNIMRPFPSVPPLPMRQPSPIPPKVDQSLQRPSQESCGEYDES